MVERDFLGFINDKLLFGPTDRVLLAVSGGLDSVVMAALFHRTGLRFAIAHVNFGLRDDESDGDALFVQNIADHYGVPFHLTRFDTTAFAAGRGISIQMAARELRYNWFDQLIREHGYAGVATAHHQNDVLETMLLNLTRGTGLAGFHGIAARQGAVIRPLLFATRAQLAHYAETTGLVYREDRSNADDKYARNRIRHQVVPVLTDLNPGLWQTLPRTIDRLRAAETIVRAELDRRWQQLAEPTDTGVFLPVDVLRATPELAFSLAEWIKPFGFSDGQVSQILKVLNRQTGQVFQSATHRIVHDRLSTGRTGLLLDPLSAGPSPPEIVLKAWPSKPIQLTGRHVLTVGFINELTGFKAPADPAIACLDADKLDFPLTLRPWTLGDRFRPIGLNGHKLISDFLTDLKVPRPERERVTVLVSGTAIVWVIGYRIAHGYRVTADTKRVVRLAVQYQE